METNKEIKALDFKSSIDVINSSLNLLKVITSIGIREDVMNKAEENIINKEDFISKLK